MATRDATQSDSEAPNNNTAPKPQKRPVPPQLVGHTFDVKPENANKHGRPKSADQLRKLIQEEMAEEVEVIEGKGKRKKKKVMSAARAMVRNMIRDQRIWQKQQLALNYGYGKPPEKIQITGTPVIQVTLKKKDDAGSSD